MISIEEITHAHGGNVIGSDGAFLQAFPVDADGNTTGTTTANLRIPGTNEAGSRLDAVSMDEKGVVSAAYADGSTAKLGRVAVATFVNPEGLRPVGNANWSVTGNSGPSPSSRNRHVMERFLTPLKIGTLVCLGTCKIDFFIPFIMRPLLIVRFPI